jgi:hypothetical protein
MYRGLYNLRMLNEEIVPLPSSDSMMKPPQVESSFLHQQPLADKKMEDGKIKDRKTGAMGWFLFSCLLNSHALQITERN